MFEGKPMPRSWSELDPGVGVAVLWEALDAAVKPAASKPWGDDI